MNIEPLESRIAPALLTGNVLTYTDVDGDFVKVTFTGATMLPTDFSFVGGLSGVDTVPEPFIEVNLVGKTGAGFTLTATPKAGKGDSHANINSINATGTDVGTIKVDGDVVGIVVGSGAPGTVGLKSFTALSLGQATTGSAMNTLKNVGSFTVKTDVSNGTFTFTGGVKSLTIGGNLQEFGSNPAKLDITGDVGTLKIGGSVIGRASGQANIRIGNAGTFSIGGSVIGADVFSGIAQVQAGDVKTFSIGGDLRGGGGGYGGHVSLGSVGTATIGGSIIATDNVSSNGLLAIGGDAKSITIGGSIVGGDTSSGSIFDNGALEVFGNVGTLKLGRDLIAGRVIGGSVIENGAIAVSGTVGTMTIGGSVIGDSTHTAYISVAGGATTASLAAIKTLKIKGGVVHTRLLAGYSFADTARNLDAGFGSISIGGNLVASSIVAGSGKGGDLVAGTADDPFVSTTATIGSVKIGGTFQGIPGSVTAFKIYAPIVNKLTVAKATYNHAQLLAVVNFNAIGSAFAASEF